MLSFGALSCDENGHRAPPPLPSAEPAPAPTRDLAKLLGVDAGELETRINPPAPAGDLAGDIEHFTTLDACVEERAGIDPLVGDALEAIGYDTFLRDTCRVLDAAKAGDPTRCSGIEASSLEAQCRAVVAQVKGDPDLCPWHAPSRPSRGREPKCVALAARNPLLCGAASNPLDRATCEAALGRDPRRCASLGAAAEQARCRRDTQRWASLLAGGGRARGQSDARCIAGDASALEAAPGELRGAVHLEALAPAGQAPDQAASFNLNLAPELARGVVVVTQHDDARLTIGPLREGGLDFIAPSPHVRATFAIELSVPPAPPTHKSDLPAHVERAELLVPGRAPMASPGGRTVLTATVDGAPRCRGGAVHFTVDGEMYGPESSWRLHGEGTTFVRDVVRGSMAGGEVNPGGVDPPVPAAGAGMR